LAINADDRMDYSGQTVNIAMVQNLAKGSEIWITELVLKANGVHDIFNANGYREENNRFFSKALDRPLRFIRCIALQGA
jgi:class 3 adenylate cyclase